MSEKLIESILEKNFVLAENLFQERLNIIMEKKLYEKKRMIAAEMQEALGGLTQKEIDDRKKAGYRKASEVLGDPSNKKLPGLDHKFKKVKKKVNEVIEVQPDPEGRIRGGNRKSSKSQQTIRNIAAKAIKVGRKIGGGEFRKGYFTAKKDIETKNILRPSNTQGPKEEPKAEPTTEPSYSGVTPKKPWLQRNINTLRGRDPDYDSKDPKNQPRGGKLGKAVRSGIGAVLGAVAQAGE